MDPRRKNKKVQYAISLMDGKEKDIQKALEEKRNGHIIDVTGHMINSKEVLFRLNQIEFIQEDIRPIPEDSAWSMAVVVLQNAVIKRITTLLLIANPGQGVNAEAIFPFRVRFLCNIEHHKGELAYEPNEEIKNEHQLNLVLKEVTAKFREKLASIHPEDATIMLYNIKIRMFIFEYLYDSEKVVML